MSVPVPPQPIPIAINEQGVWCVEGSRVTVDSIIHEFRRGSTPEQIQDDFPTLTLAQIYAVIGYCLHHPQEVDAYLAQQAQATEQERERWAQMAGVDSLRTRLRAARDAQARGGV